MKFSIIKNSQQYNQYMAELEKLLDLEPEEGTEEFEEKELLMLLVEKYEKDHYQIEECLAIDTINFIIKQNELKQKDLITIFGSQSRVSEVLSAKRQLSSSMIENLHKYLNIPFELLHKAKNEVADQIKRSKEVINVDDKYLKMVKKIYIFRKTIHQYSNTLSQFKKEQLISLISNKNNLSKKTNLSILKHKKIK